MTDEPSLVPEPAPRQVGVALPLTRPVITYALLGIVTVIFLAEVIAGRSFDPPVETLIALGAQMNSLIVEGAYWRLLTAMFLHGSVMHLAFNGWALYSLGREVEAFYGYRRFALVFVIAGLAGNVASYLFGSEAPSVGASGAIFGLIGAEIAFFVLNRGLFGTFGRQRLVNLLIVAAINLFFGFTQPRINNLAHLGGLLGGLALSLALAPRYRIAWGGFPPTPRLTDRQNHLVWVVAIATTVVVLVGGVWLGGRLWSAEPDRLRQRAETALAEDNWPKAQGLLQQVIAVAPSDAAGRYTLGIVYARQGQLPAAAGELAEALRLAPDNPNAVYTLGLVYAELGRPAEARVLLERYLVQNPQNAYAQSAREVLAQLP